jgi:hypothetical protein
MIRKFFRWDNELNVFVGIHHGTFLSALSESTEWLVRVIDDVNSFRVGFKVIKDLLVA